MSRSPTGIDLNRMALFALVAETKSMSEAARRLGVGRAAVSRDMAQLEKECGVRLLNRTTQSIGLTPVGESFFTACQHVLEYAQAGADLVRGEQTDLIGPVRIAATTEFGRLVVIDVVAQLTAEHPQMTFDLLFKDEMTDLVTEGVEVAFRVGNMPTSDYRALRVGTTRYLLVCTPEYAATHAHVTDPTQLSPSAFVRFAVRRSTHRWRFESEDDAVEVEAQGAVQVNDSASLMALVKKGRHYCPTLDFIANPLIEHQTLVQLLPQWKMSYEIPIWAVWPHTQLSAKARAVVDAVAAHLQKK